MAFQHEHCEHRHDNRVTKLRESKKRHILPSIIAMGTCHGWRQSFRF